MQSLFHVSMPTFSLENDQLQFVLDNDKTVRYDLNQYDMKTRHDPYSFDSYTLRNSDIHLEYIHRDHNTDWNGFSRGFYESLLKEKLKLKSLESIKREEFGNFEFSTYRVNDSFIIHLIFIWETHKDIFIVDTKGKLFSSLMSALKQDYEYEYKDQEKGSVNFDISLVKNNAFNSYFNQCD